MSTVTTTFGLRDPTATPGFDRLHRLLAGGSDDNGMGFLQDVVAVHHDVTDALLGFVYAPSSHSGLDEFLGPLPGAVEAQRGRGTKRPRACIVEDGGDDGPCVELPAGARGAVAQQVRLALPELVTGFVPTPPPMPVQQHWQLPDAVFVRGAGAEPKKGGEAGNGHHNQAVQSAAARERRRRISNKTAELSRLIPGAAKLNSTAEMLQAAARHVKLLQAQVGMLALMQSAGETKMVPSMAAQEERVHALLVSGGVQERLAGEGVCLVPTKLVHAIADDKAIKSNPVVNRDLSRFMESLEQ
ncbi:hypothetical protein E2562_029293 [Oryza meyeriana var. granulata]|uniref:BHLH domain-containing protein n=1 Tax=Oryza meyeriana var. granulata TaxID=110450 RepID=A0A6G1BNR5_9ORYZ|nr:hypothetical protein E2562_029293 [Oryza meyeriana var. granulata]